VNESLIRWIMSNYGHLIPKGTMEAKDLGTSIRKHYYCGSDGDGPINETAAKIAENNQGMYESTTERIIFTPVLARQFEPVVRGETP
jgi:hypothetical protein